MTSRRDALAGAVVADKRGAARAALMPLANLYALGARAHLGLYVAGVLRRARLATPVISVGNLTLGGTGKTPLVAAIARDLRDRGSRVVVLTRGYGRTSREREVLTGAEAGAVERGGDEPALLARELGDVPVVVDSDRAGAGRWAERELAPDVFLLDDGFQHHALARDVDVLVVDASDPFGGGATPPVGRLREPVSGGLRADVVVVTRSRRATDRAALETSIRRIVRPGTPIFFVDTAIHELRPVAGGPAVEVARLAGSRVGVIAAVGNPVAFVADVERAGLRVVARAFFADHHAYSAADLSSAAAEAEAASAVALVGTEKDAVKLERLALPPLPLYAARARLEGDVDPFLAELRGRLEKAVNPSK